MKNTFSKLSSEDFFADYFKDLKNCPFFYQWHETEFRLLIERYERNMLPIMDSLKAKKATGPEVQPRVNKYHAAHTKNKFALFRAFNRFSLKDFARSFEVKYKVLRVWGSRAEVKDKIIGYAFAFIDAFFNEIKKHNPPPDAGSEYLKDATKRNQQLRYLLDEARFYAPHIQWMVLQRITKEEEANPQNEMFWAAIAIRLADAMLGWSITTPPKNPRDRKEYISSTEKKGVFMLALIESLYSDLRDFIAKGETAQALAMADFLQDATTELQKDKTYLSILILNKGKEVKKKG